MTSQLYIFTTECTIIYVGILTMNNFKICQPIFLGIHFSTRKFIKIIAMYRLIPKHRDEIVTKHIEINRSTSLGVTGRIKLEYVSQFKKKIVKIFFSLNTSEDQGPVL